MDPCPGSGNPTRTDGSCDRCFAADVRDEYVRIDPTDGGRRFVVFPSFGYYTAREHEPVRETDR